MEEQKRNEFIEPEDYYAGYQESIDKLKNRPELVAFDKLCHLVFHTPDGKALIEELKRCYLIPALCSPAHENFDKLTIYFEGFKEAFRQIIHCVESHDKIINAEQK